MLLFELSSFIKGSMWAYVGSMDNKIKKIAIARINTLFYLANKNVHRDESLTQRYSSLARKIAMTSKVRIPKKYRLQICRYCKNFIYPGKTCLVRLKQQREPHIVITCLKCGKKMRLPLRNKNK